MKTRAQSDLENLALSAELSRQLAHDFNNFLYNLLLQIEICDKVAKTQQPDWSRIKHEYRKMAARLQQWQRFHNRFTPAPPSKIDLHEMIQQAVAEGAPPDAQVTIEPSISSDRFSITNSPLEVSHLLRLMLEAALQACQESAGPKTLAIQLGRIEEKVTVRIEAQDTATGSSLEPEGDDERTLVESACYSLAIRLDATIQRERRAGSYAIAVEFPLSEADNR